VPGEREEARDGVTVGAVPRGSHCERPRRVRGDHLDLYALSRLGECVQASRASGGSDHRADRAGEPFVAKEEVHEARAGDLGTLDDLEPGGRLCDLGRDLTRSAPLCSREAQRDVRGVVAVLGLRRPLELELCSRRGRERGCELPDRISRQRSRRQ
jgi:hypothetical protein